MPHSFGYRARTRHLFRKGFRKHGVEQTTTYLRTFKVGDYVDIVANSAQQKGMPFKFYHGRTGIVWNVTPRAVGVIIMKRVGHRIIPKRIHVRIEHVRPSTTRDFHLQRVADNDTKARNAKESGERYVLKRDPAGVPEDGKFVSGSIEHVTPLEYVFTV
eukprot:TRINITY_DN11501_c1_g1_i1.p1 TRINITY_DN11501_c1_g1~~TRINITY_DN11501_c1_g1_i1.p1  ORF type:complete len:159 (-),score=28.38 TRINITY_DN11501_c1_g1_i1:52-528(-)